MRLERMVCAAVAAIGMLLVSTGAYAQVKYRCSVNGSTYFSDRPCPSTLKYGGPTESEYRPARQSVPQSVGKAPDHLSYLSAPCAQLNDAIRTAPARGVGYSVQNDLRDEYRRKCADDEANAHRQMSRDQAERRQQLNQQADQQQAARQSAKASSERCSELLRILAARRKKYDSMTPGERVDHDRSEANYIERCQQP